MRLSARLILGVLFAVGLLCSSPAVAQDNVAWTKVVNASASGNVLRKTGGCNGCQDAGALTVETIKKGVGSFQFAVAGNQELYVGLTSVTTTPLYANDIRYAFAIHPDNSCEIRESGAVKAACTFTGGDVLTIAIEPGPVVTYYRNGGAIYASSAIPSNYPYALGADLFTVGGAIAAIQTVTRAATVPTSYKATTSRFPFPKPMLPKLGAAGFRFRDPVFKSSVLRVTDANTRPGSPGRSFTVSSAAHQLAWNATSDHFYIRSIDGTFIPYSFKATTMTASRIAATTSGDGGLVIRSQVEPQFSFVSANLLFGSRQDPGHDWPIIQQFDFNTLSYTDILNLGSATTIQPGTYAGALSSSATTPEKLCVMFGGSSQDSHYKVAVFPLSGTGPVVLDSLASTITANGSTSTTNIPLGVYLHHVWIDQSGRYVILYTVNQQPVPYYVWDLDTGAIAAVSTNPDGHDATGFRWQINQSCCTTTTWDAAQWQRRALSDPATTADLINPVLTPQEIYLADHTSWNNAQPGALVPILSSLYRYYNGTYNTTPWRAWDDEIVAIETGQSAGGARVWRFAHHRSDSSYDGNPNGIYFWYVPNAIISPDGRWAIFTSNWEKTLGAAVGSDVQPGGAYRCDVFLVALQ